VSGVAGLGVRTRDLLLASARAAHRCENYEAPASLAGWLLAHAGGDAHAAMLLDAPIGQLRLAQARSHLLSVIAEETFARCSTLSAPAEVA
jgi:hypothetical protein